MSDLGPKFYQKLVEVSSSLGMQPEHILNVMGLESNFTPNVPGSAVGLVQILPRYLGNLGYTGSAEDFRNEPPEKQLIYISRLIKSNIDHFNGGRPFKSLTQYYVSNFLPACLTRQDIQNEDPNAILASANPTTPHIPHHTIEFEKDAYKKNEGLDFDKDGNITYGDLTAKLAQVASRKSYREQLANLQTHTGYQSRSSTGVPARKPISHESEYAELVRRFTEQTRGGTNMDFLNQQNGNSSATQDIPLENMVDQLLQNIRASEKDLKKLYKLALPTNSFVIKILANDTVDKIEFGRILCSALHEELLARAFIHSNNKDVEVHCEINGPHDLCYDTVSQLTSSLKDVFKLATIKIGGININTDIVSNKKPSYSVLTTKSAISNYDKFLLKFVK